MLEPGRWGHGCAPVSLHPRLIPVALLLASACGTRNTQPLPTSWSPGVVFQAERAPNARGLLDRHGLVHAHTPYSHDACDGKPRDANGVYDESCAQDFRRGLCQARHDFAFLTDHPSSFTDGEFPEVLQSRAAKGDVLVSHGARPTANRLACPDGTAPLILAGTESSWMMPVGLDEHAAATPSARRDIYDSDTSNAQEQVKAKGAVALIAHTEGWTADRLSTLPIDGFEMYNLHANTFKNAGEVADLLLNHIDKGDSTGLPVPDAFFASYVLEDTTYTETWGSTLARGVKRVTTMGTDCHRNSLPQLLQDGERDDSYRRMMIAFSNHLLVKPQADGTWDDRDLKDALRAGRLYGVFEFMGYAKGFDFVAVEAGAEHEMGETVSLANGVTLRVTMPSIQQLDPAAPAPTLTLRLLRARDGGWDEVASTTDASLEHVATAAGAYRAEVRIVPRHLRPYIGTRVGYVKNERPWVYSNAIYVAP